MNAQQKVAANFNQRRGKGRRKRGWFRPRTLFSARLGRFDPRPTSGGSPQNQLWKKYHAWNEYGVGTDPRFSQE